MKTLLLAITVILTVSSPATCNPDQKAISINCSNGYAVIHYYPGYQNLARNVAGLVDESAFVMAEDLGMPGIDSIEVWIAPGRDEYSRLFPGIMPEWSEACSYIPEMAICINADAVLKSSRPLRIVVRHELSHLILAQRVNGTAVPRWFMEGVAMIQSGEWSLSDQWEFLLAAWQKDCPVLGDTERAFSGSGRRSAYMLSYFAVRELLSEREDDLITLTAFTRDQKDFNRGFFLTFGETPEDFSARIDLLIKEKYRNVLFLAASAPFWVFIGLLFIAAYLLKKRRMARKLKEWEEEERMIFGDDMANPADR